MVEAQILSPPPACKFDICPLPTDTCSWAATAAANSLDTQGSWNVTDPHQDWEDFITKGFYPLPALTLLREKLLLSLQDLFSLLHWILRSEIGILEPWQRSQYDDQKRKMSKCVNGEGWTEMQTVPPSCSMEACSILDNAHIGMGLFWPYSIFQWVCVRWLMPYHQLCPVKVEKQKASLKTLYLMSKNSNTRNVMHLHWCRVGVHVEGQTHLKGQPGKPCQVLFPSEGKVTPASTPELATSSQQGKMERHACCASLINLTKVIYPAHF